MCLPGIHAIFILEEEIRRAVAKVRHPEIDNTLAELETIKEITVRDDKVLLTGALLFPGIPIRDYLVRSVRETIMKLCAGIEVRLKEKCL